MEQKNKQKYFCKECNVGFVGIKSYIEHMNQHKQLVDELPEEKKPFLDRLFSKFRKKKVRKIVKTEGNKMDKKQEKETKKEEVNEEQTETQKEDIPQEDTMDRIDGIERGLSQLSSLIAEKFGISNEELQPEEPQDTTPGKKKVKISVIVNEKQSGELLKHIQSNDAYEMDDISVVKG